MDSCLSLKETSQRISWEYCQDVRVASFQTTLGDLNQIELFQRISLSCRKLIFFLFAKDENINAEISLENISAKIKLSFNRRRD